MVPAAQYEKGLTFEKVWAMFQETDRKMQETDRKIQETDRIVKENAKAIGKLSNRFGEVVEYMVVPNLVTKFNEMGFTFKDAHRDAVIEDPEHGIFAEVDVTLRNSDSVMIVETKAKPNARDIDDHITRMEKLRAYANLHNDMRNYYGAIAGIVVSSSIKERILSKGFYAIEPSGETFIITKPTGTHTPKAW
jgi:hypothetical protein